MASPRTFFPPRCIAEEDFKNVVECKDQVFA
jgi:hypothetical protein